MFLLFTLTSCLQNSNSSIEVASSAPYKPINPGEDEALKKADKLITASLEIALMDGLNIKDFIIAKDCTITIYKRKTNDEKRGKIKSYKINDVGSIIEIKQ